MDGTQGQEQMSPASDTPPISEAWPASSVARWFNVRPGQGKRQAIGLRWLRLDFSWKLALWLLFTLRVGLGLVAVLSIRLMPITHTGGMLTNLVMPGTAVWTQLLSTWQRFDALWYQQIAQHGYHAGTLTAAFYPLYPLVTHIVSLPMGGHIVVAELLVSSVAFVFAMWLLYGVARLDSNRQVATLTVLLTAFFPAGFFLLAPYTESLYLALTLAAFYLARRDRFWAAGGAGLGAALTHEPGMFLALPLAFHYVWSHRSALREGDFNLLSAALPLLAPIVFMAYQRFIVGEHRSLFQFQAAPPFGYHTLPPWQVLSDSWTQVVRYGDSVELLNLVSLVGFTLLAIPLIRRFPPMYLLYVWTYLALLFTREMLLSPFMSVSRLVMVLFPCFIMLAIWLVRRPWLAAGVLGISLLLQVTFFQYWVHYGFVA